MASRAVRNIQNSQFIRVRFKKKLFDFSSKLISNQTRTVPSSFEWCLWIIIVRILSIYELSDYLSDCRPRYINVISHSCRPNPIFFLSVSHPRSLNPIFFSSSLRPKQPRVPNNHRSTPTPSGPVSNDPDSHTQLLRQSSSPNSQVVPIVDLPLQYASLAVLFIKRLQRGHTYLSLGFLIAILVVPFAVVVVDVLVSVAGCRAG
jgi:hypothetical protein